MPDADDIKHNYLNALKHTYVAYHYFSNSLPPEQAFVNGQQVQIGAFCFRTYQDAFSMRVELGWAFFTRFEAIVEAFLSKREVRLKRNYTLLDHLQRSEVDIPEAYVDGLKFYRELRNTLHHGDGDIHCLRRKTKYLSIPENHEPQILEEHMSNYYDLFRWLAEVI